MLDNTTFRFKLRSSLKSAAMLYGILALVAIFMSVLFVVNTRDISGTVHYSFGGLEFASAIFMFVLGNSMVSEDLPLLVANGISRRSQFITQLCVLLLLALCMAVFEMIVTTLLSQFLPYQSMFVQAENIIASFTYGSGAASVLLQPNMMLTGICWAASIYLMAYGLGFFRASLFKLIPRRLKGVVIIALAVIILWGIPGLNQSLGYALSSTNAALFGSTPIRHTLYFAGCAVLLLGTGFLLFRRIQLTTLRK